MRNVNGLPQFHEITHHLLEENEDLICELDEYTYGQEDRHHPQIEYLCNVGAAEFLMPSKEFVTLYEERGFNVQLIPFAANYFKSSTIARNNPTCTSSTEQMYCSCLRKWINTK